MATKDNINHHKARLYTRDGELLASGTRENIYRTYEFKPKKATLKQTVKANDLILEDLSDPSKSVNLHLLNKFQKNVKNENQSESDKEKDNSVLLLRSKKQIILYGPPGTGKTYSTKDIALELINEFPEEEEGYEELRDKGRIEFITFHPSYSYEEFIEGITVETEREGIATESVKYKLRPGIFKEMCKRALGAAIGLSDEEMKDKTWKEVFEDYDSKKNDLDFENTPPYVLIIDEINRGDMAKIFGELITLLEVDKRIGEENELIATLPTSGDRFGVPSNLYIIGTMNTADRSIALLDVALRRRFGFKEMNPDFKLLEKHLNTIKDTITRSLLESSIEALKRINKKICTDKTIGRDKQIGHSYLFRVKDKDDLAIVWRHEILPLFEEYCYGDYQKINQMLFNSDSDTEWISQCEGIKDITAEDLEKMLEETNKP